MEVFSSEQVAALRIVIAFLFLLPLMLKHYKVNLKKYWFGILMMGTFGNLIPAFLFTRAETGISSEKLRRADLRKEGSKSGTNNLSYALMVAAATFCYAISVNSIKKYLNDINSITATVWSFTFIGSFTIVA